MSDLRQEVDRRRTFAIISHPDAGKTTLTEKILLFGGAIQLAGMVKARGERRRARSDWMKVEQERGISVTASVMTFGFDGRRFNLLDTPGHEDFSEDTYRTLTAVDSAVMVLDAAKGIETQTRKLFEVCRLRDVPIITFVNKLDRDGQDPFALLDEIEDTLQLETTPRTWPIGMGQSFRGCYDFETDEVVFMERQKKGAVASRAERLPLDDPQTEARLGATMTAELREQIEMVRELCPPLDLEAYRAGNLTPVFFGSALNTFGVSHLLEGLAEMAPSPRPQEAAERWVEPLEERVSGFVFKIQANMDPNHRDRIAFVRLCSGRFNRGMKLLHTRSGKNLSIHNPMLFLAQDRELAEEAFAGDIIGIPNHGNLRIGDTLSEREELRFTGIPSFAPELLKKVRAEDPLRAKHLGRALQQLAEEGAAQVFRRAMTNEWIVGVAGALQFDVLADRIRTEYGLDVIFETTSVYASRWVEADDPATLKRFVDANQNASAEDHDGSPVFFARNAWHLDRAGQDWPDVRFLSTREQQL
ncbi:MAG: peptide chain release factor 3 [Acidobacteriota bacterium]